MTEVNTPLSLADQEAVRIVKVSVYSHCNELVGGLWNPAIRWTNKHSVFVEVEDEAGRIGLGECWCFDSQPDALVAFLKTEVLPHYVGISRDEALAARQWPIADATLTSRHGILASAQSGVDIALWDLEAQAAALPLWKALDPAASGRVRLYASGGLYGEKRGLAELQTEFANMRQRGFSMAKIKVGGLDREADWARANATLEALAPDGRIIVDGVYSFSTESALEFFRGLPKDRVEAFQSPVAASDLAGMAWLVERGVPVMAVEAEHRPEMHRRLVEEACVSILQTAPVASGGISRLLELQELAAGTAVRLSLEVSSTSVALLAACHAAAALPAIAHVEYHMVHDVFFDTLRLVPLDGETSVFGIPDEPGLGMALADRPVQLHCTVDA